MALLKCRMHVPAMCNLTSKPYFLDFCSFIVSFETRHFKSCNLFFSELFYSGCHGRFGYSSCIYFVKFVPKYSTFFDAIINRTFKMTISNCLLLENGNIINYFMLSLYLAALPSSLFSSIVVVIMLVASLGFSVCMMTLPADKELYSFFSNPYTPLVFSEL